VFKLLQLKLTLALSNNLDNNIHAKILSGMRGVSNLKKCRKLTLRAMHKVEIECRKLKLSAELEIEWRELKLNAEG